MRVLAIPNFSQIILELKKRKRNEVFPFLFLFVLSQNADTGKLAQLYWIDHTENYYRTLQLATKYDGKEHVLHKFSQWTIPVFSFEEDFPAQPSYAGYRTYWIQFPNGSGEAIDLGWMYESDIISYIKNSIMPKYNLTVIRYQGSIGGKKSEGFITR